MANVGAVNEQAERRWWASLIGAALGLVFGLLIYFAWFGHAP